jgi:hypothetical protein
MADTLRRRDTGRASAMPRDAVIARRDLGPVHGGRLRNFYVVLRLQVAAPHRQSWTPGMDLMTMAVPRLV